MLERLLGAKKTASTTTWDPSYKGPNTTLSADYLTATASQGNGTATNKAYSSGKVYGEVLVNSFEQGTAGPVVGLTNRTATSYVWSGPGEFVYYTNTSIANKYQLIYGSNVRFNYGSGYAVGDYLGVAVDFTANVVSWWVNGVNQGNEPLSTYVTTTKPFYLGISSPGAGAAYSCSVTYQQSPLYLPDGFDIW